jgi:Flp pilus assembly pilin Flp
MSIPVIWLAKLVFAHLLSDFILQPAKWVEERQRKHFASGKLYLHGLITGIVALIVLGPEYWLTVAAVTTTHIIIDGWKSYQPDKAIYFLLDQALHLAVILICWWMAFFTIDDLLFCYNRLSGNTRFWIIATSYLFLSFPAGIMIGKFTKRWQDQIREAAAEISALADAGKWIGILERTIILTLILQEQYGAIGLLIAAKSILRFNQTNSQEARTEYVLIGSLISIGLAIVTGILVQYILQLSIGQVRSA